MTAFDSPRDAFPLLRQLLYDSFQVDSCLFTFPYQDLDRIDNSIRRTLWGDGFHNPSGFQEMWKNFSDRNILVVKSTLRFYNILCLLPFGEHPDFISVGPFRDQEINAAFLNSAAHENHLTGEAFLAMRKYYSAMPLADPEAVTAFLSHFFGFLIPGYDSQPPVQISFSETVQRLISDQALWLPQDARRAEQYAKGYRETIGALQAGDSDEAQRALHVWLSVTGFLEEPHSGQLRRRLWALNEIFASALLVCPIHPVYVRELAREMQIQIDGTENHEQLCALPRKLLRRYCLLVKTESHGECSALTRRIIDYIHIHLSEDLSLSVIAKKFDRHPSTLSGMFRKETGMTVTAYIRQERIRKAIGYLNTSSLEIREIASSLGFHDLGYFSRVFRSETGMSPSEYRKLMSSK